MINFDALDFSECRSEEVISFFFFTLSVVNALTMQIFCALKSFQTMSVSTWSYPLTASESQSF